MAKAQHSKTQPGRSGLGAALHGIGSYVVMATLEGSYGETSHRAVGQIHWHPEEAAKVALRRHAKGESNVEVVDLKTGVRVTAQRLLDILNSLTLETA